VKRGGVGRAAPVAERVPRGDVGAWSCVDPGACRELGPPDWPAALRAPGESSPRRRSRAGYGSRTTAETPNRRGSRDLAGCEGASVYERRQTDRGAQASGPAIPLGLRIRAWRRPATAPAPSRADCRAHARDEPRPRSAHGARAADVLALVAARRTGRRRAGRPRDRIPRRTSVSRRQRSPRSRSTSTSWRSSPSSASSPSPRPPRTTRRAGGGAPVRRRAWPPAPARRRAPCRSTES